MVIFKDSENTSDVSTSGLVNSKTDFVFEIPNIIPVLLR